MSADLKLVIAPEEDKELHWRPPGPVSRAFLHAAERIVGIRGPFGSGKSVSACIKLLLHIESFPPCKDGVRRTKLAIVRNTYPELKSTTIPTWEQWARGPGFGEIVYGAPITQAIRFRNEEGKLTHQCDVMFLALDKPKDVRRVLSMEISAAWVNEARELPKAIIDAIESRIDRYPRHADKHPDVTDEEWLRYRQVLMDTNSMDQDHWWYKLAEETKPEGYRFFTQPAGDSGRAENLMNLTPGYYERLKRGKTPQWVKVYIQNEYGTVSDGKPVYTEYNDHQHHSEVPLVVMKGLPLFLGWDFGRTPACIICQITSRGQLRVLDEICAMDMGVTNFAAKVVKPYLMNNYSGMPITSLIDPSGLDKGDKDEQTCFEILDRLGLNPEGAPTNNFTSRREAVANALSWNVDGGQPGLILDPKCKMLRAGFLGKYELRRMQVTGEERWTEAPDKNKYSHPHDALQYVAMRLEVPETPKVRRFRNAKQRGAADRVAGY